MTSLLLPAFRSASSLPSAAHLFGSRVLRHVFRFSTTTHELTLPNSPPVVRPVVSPDALRSTHAHSSSSTDGAASSKPKPTPAAAAASTSAKARPRLRPSKAAITLAPAAVSRLRSLLTGPTPQYIRIGVRNKGCAGMSYHLEYVDKPDKFDEVVEQDGVKVLIDSRALFSIIGSEMNWQEDKLSARFSFKNPNIKDACGCGESFSVVV